MKNITTLILIAFLSAFMAFSQTTSHAQRGPKPKPTPKPSPTTTPSPSPLGTPSPTATPTPTPTATPTPEPTPTTKMRLKGVTANLQHGQFTNGTFNYGGQAQLITPFADFVTAQEVSVGDIPNWDAAFNAGGFTRVVSKMHPAGGDGNAIWARSTLQVEAIYTHDLSNVANPTSGSTTYGYDGNTDIRRSVVAARFNYNNKPFNVVSVHFCHSRCRDDGSGNTQSVQRVSQIQDLLSWVDATLTGPVLIMGDFNLTLDTAKQPSGFQFDLFRQAGYCDLWEIGLANGVAEANWDDRNNDTIPDMPLGMETRTADTRRIDFIVYRAGNGLISLVKIWVPDQRGQCPSQLEPSGACPTVVQRIGLSEDSGPRPADHNWVWVELEF